MPKARLYFDGDDWIQKDSRIYKLRADIAQKIENVPAVIDNTSSSSRTDALSANMWRDLQEQINNLAARGRYLSTRNAATWLPDTNPQTSPYVYRAWDYYIVSNIWVTNYRPQWASYTIWVASTAQEHGAVSVNDLYIYDWVQWILQWSTSTSVAWWSIVWNIANQWDLQNALDDKQDELTAGDGISIDSNNVISNTLPWAIVDAIAPSNPSQWDLWYDTTANKLKTYDGTQWNETWVTYVAWANIQINGTTISATDTKYNAWRNISIDWTTVNARDTVYTAWSNVTIICPVKVDNQWPCPDGFHVPTKTERWDTMRILNNVFWFAANHSTPETYLKMPDAWCRYFSTGVVQDHWGYYWSSTPVGPEDAGFFYYYGPAFYYPENSTKRSQGCSIRPFKDNAVTPDSSWTAIYDWSSIVAWAWIFHNATEWLISISWDWINWTTIADKNLWATTVWNNGDTKTQANCGNHYQRWNNYGFPFSWTVDTKTTKPDASWHWPWNYYYSSTYTIVPNSPWDWSSVQNDNLWWWANPWTWQDCEHPIISATQAWTEWWDITWTLSDQTDLQTALNAKQDKMSAWNNIDISWTTINARDTEYTAGSNVTITCPTESDMKWPCPSGFHVPTTNEQQWLNTIMTSLSLTTWDSWRINLHMPFAGRRNRPDASLNNQGSYGYYWSSSPDSANDYARSISLSSSSVSARSTSSRGVGFSIRCFKNEYIAPDSSWTVVQWTLWGAWIFWNQSEWLISITDGTTGYTIMDKNLWATAVYNDWDTLTQANMGNMYQWWNNYWFSSTWTISNTSATQVDASWYWPANPYLNSTFITSQHWSSVQNDNLWWWVTQWTRQDCEHPIISAAGWATYTAWNWINIDSNNTITNTGVLSVNGRTGDVITFYNQSTPPLSASNWDFRWVAGTGNGFLQVLISGDWVRVAPDEVIVSASTPTTPTPTEWKLWYDTSNDVLKSYDWTNWNTVNTDTTYTAWIWINIDANNEISNTLPWPTIAATAPSNSTEWALWYDTTNDVLMAHDWTAWKEAWTQMKVLSYGNSTWQDFLDAYNENAIVYCRASSNSNPASWAQWRMAFMAFVSINSWTWLPTSVEFQYYRSRSDHNTQANQLDQVFVYTLTSASWWTWSVTERNTWAKAVAWTWINLTFGSGNMTISADTTTLATQTDLAAKQDTLVSWTNIKSINNESLLWSWDISINWIVSWQLVPAASSQWEGRIFYCTSDNTFYKCDWTAWTEIWGWGITNDVTWTTSTVTKIWAWTETEYNNLSSYDSTTIYHIY